MEFEFPDGVTLKTAFETFDEAAKNHADAIVAKSKADAAANRVLPATSLPKNIVGIDGKPFKG
jgi:hypothetical protein